ncbi:MAG TPA: AsmA family protein [Ferrovibrio sp.]|uniref:AsmA family protein n=1 Tax=Ferrovibrio sp. TaxID=1917215 RepID=UPI002ED264A9
MRLKTVLLGLVILVAALSVTAVAIVSSIDFNQYRDLIAGQVKQATGREFAIKGDLKFEFGLSPAIAVNDVTFANAPWGSRPVMAQARRFEAQVVLLPLIFGNVNVKRVVLVDADILLETDARGRGNWEFATETAAKETAPQAPTSDEPALARLSEIDEIDIRNARLVYRDGRTNQTTTLAVQQARLGADSPTDPLRIELDGAYNDIAFHVGGHAGSVQAMSQSRAPFPVSINGRIGDAATFRVDGTVRAPIPGGSYDLSLHAEGPEIAQVARIAGVQLPALGPFRADIRAASGEGDRLSVPELKLALGEQQLLTASVSGSIADVRALSGIRLDIAAEAPELRAVAERAGVEAPIAGPLRLTGKVADAGPERYALSGFQLVVGNSDLAGEATFARGGARPTITANFTSKQIDLAALSAPPRGPGGNAAPPQPTPADGRVFADEPLPFDVIDATDGEVHYRAERIVGGGAPIGELALTAAWRNGTFNLRPFSADIGGGKLTMELGVNARTQSITGKVDAKGIELGTLLEQTGISDLLRRGKTDFALEMRGAGRTMRALMAALDGTSTLHVGEGALQSRYIDLLGADVVRVLSPLQDSGSQTSLNCVVGRVEIKDGVATPKVLFAETGKMVIGGAGAVNLGTEQIDLIITPRPKDASLMSLAVPIRVRGTLANPSFSPDTGAALKGAAGAVAGALLLGPAGVLVPFVSGGQGGDATCANALAQAGLRAPVTGTPAQPAPGTTAPPQQAPAQPAPANPIEGIERGLRGLFGR